MIMAILRSKQIRDLSAEDFQKKMNEIRLELAKERGKISIGSPADNPGKIRELRKTIARMITIKQEKSSQKKQ